MPPKRKSATKLNVSDGEALHPDALAREDEGAAPRKRGRKSMLDAFLQEEGAVVCCAMAAYLTSG
jgi:hypothetical protein